MLFLAPFNGRVKHGIGSGEIREAVGWNTGFRRVKHGLGRVEHGLFPWWL
jgi:hypothetical protein